MRTIAMVLAASTPVEPQPTAWWLGPLMAALGIIFGGGGVAAIMKARYDRQQGIAQMEVAEDDAVSARWQKIIEAQTASLVDPLRKRLLEVEATVARLEAELGVVRNKYWRAIGFIRTLLSMLRVRSSTSEIPIAPEEIREDI